MIINQQPPSSGGGGGGAMHTIYTDSAMSNPVMFDFDSGEWRDIPYDWAETYFEETVGERVLIKQRNYGDSLVVKTEGGESVTSYLVGESKDYGERRDYYRVFIMPDANVIVTND